MKRMTLGVLAALGIAVTASSIATPSQAFWAKIADWGAIVYEVETGRAGYAWGYRTEAEARRAALRDARNRGVRPDRHRYRWWTVRNGCLFVYKDQNSTRFGWARSSSKSRARSVARDNCQRGGRVCRQVVWTCTRR